MGFKDLFHLKEKNKSHESVLTIKKKSPKSSPSPSKNSCIDEELKHAFKKFDLNGDGKISATELGSILGRIGHTATNEHVESLMNQFDLNGDGSIDFNEFVELNKKGIDSREDLETLKEAFAVFDLDKNGTISAYELQNVLEWDRMGHLIHNLD